MQLHVRRQGRVQQAAVLQRTGFLTSWGAEVVLRGQIRCSEPLDDEGRKYRIKVLFSLKFYESGGNYFRQFGKTVETFIIYDVKSREGVLYDKRFVSKFMTWVDDENGPRGVYFNRHIARLAPPQPPQELALNFPVEELELGVRAYNAVKRQGIETIGDLADKTEKELGTIPNFGKRLIDEVKVALKPYGLSLKK